MVYRGTIRDGRVELEGAPVLPEGARVEVSVGVLDEHTPAGASPRDVASDSQPKSAWQQLAKLAGRMNSGHHDASVNHDHYLYGAKKREPNA